MEAYQNIIEHVNKLTEDIRLEAILAELVENGAIKIKDVHVNTLGLFRRDYRREIDSVIALEDEDKQTFKSMLFSVWREGIYDSLPKGLFHDSRKEGGASGLNEHRNSHSAQKQEEQAARDFFFPVEQEFYRQRLRLELFERSIISGKTADHQLNQVFSELWRLETTNITPDQLLRLQFFLPYCFKYKGDFKKLSQIFSALLEAKVTVEIKHDQYSPVDVNTSIPTAGLGYCYLGDNLVLGHTFYDGLPYALIAVKDLTAKAAMDFLPSRNKEELLSILCEYLLPVELDFVVELSIREKDREIWLETGTGQKVDANSFLGYTTYL